MKILIIEDIAMVAEKISAALEGLGEIEICTTSDADKPNKWVMPPKEKVIELIHTADIILLDGKLSPDYDGTDLFPYCSGKKVIGISDRHVFGETNFYAKSQLSERAPEIAASLRELVTQVIAQ